VQPKLQGQQLLPVLLNYCLSLLLLLVMLQEALLCYCRLAVTLGGCAA
jgi:hypothetical protein